MLSVLLGWIPVIGPIIDGFFGFLNKKTDASVRKEELMVDENKAKIAAQTTLVTTFKDDPGVKLCRDLILFPVAVWTAITTWDKIVDIHWPFLVIGTLDFKGTLEFLPYAVLAFLFGNSFMLRNK